MPAGKYVRTEHHRQLLRMSNLGKKHSEETKQKISEGAHKGKDHCWWKGDNVGYDALHRWIRKRLPKPELCQMCNKVPPKDMANISGEYKRDLTDWLYLCRRCHWLFDNKHL